MLHKSPPWRRGATAPRGASRRDLILGGSFLAAGLVANLLVPQRSLDLLGDRKLKDVIPERIGRWTYLGSSGLVVPPSDQLRDMLYSEVLTRTYVAEGQPAMMLLVASSPAQDGTIQVHRPEYCYPASGYALKDERDYTLDLSRGMHIPARFLRAESKARVEQILYWTRIGRELPRSWKEQRLSVARQNLDGWIPDGVLVRVSTASPDPSALGPLAQFSRELIGAATRQARSFLLGSAAT